MNSCKLIKGENGFKISGAINFETVTYLYKKGTELFNDYETIRLDFSDVSQVDSSGIALLLHWLRFAKQHEKKFSFHHLPSQLLEIATVCEVMPFLNQYINTTQ